MYLTLPSPMILAFAFALALPFAGCGESGDSDFCLFAPCAENGFTAAEPGDSSTPHDYIGNLFLPGEHETLGFALHASAPVPDFVGEHTWEIALVTTDSLASTEYTLVAEPMMPAHGHGTLPQYTDGIEGGDGVHVLSAMNLYMPGVWEVRLRAYDESDSLIDSASFFFELE